MNDNSSRSSQYGLEPDGLPTLPIKPHTEVKHKIVQEYLSLFTQSMKKKWGKLVYLDLFAGPGRSEIDGSQRIISGSPLLALEIKQSFDCYIFCEKKKENISALENRVESMHHPSDVHFIIGDVNANVEKVLKACPAYSQTNTVLGLCYADIFGLSDLSFSTIQQLANRRMDFIILIPTEMDAIRNLRINYLDPDNHILDDFFGTDDWRKKWPDEESRGTTFSKFMIKFYEERMGEYNYRYGGNELIRSTNRKRSLYRLGFFSEHPLGEKFWNLAKQHHQQNLFN
ncbi:three-Cys-motif partner protein TcmP [Candidatus Neomarinimicrobiota bacterium]